MRCYTQNRLTEDSAIGFGDDFDYETAYIVEDDNGEIIWDTTDYRMVKHYFESYVEQEGFGFTPSLSTH